MYTYAKIDPTSKEALYNELVQQAGHLIEGEPNDIANMSNVSSLLNLHLADINWVGFYLWHERDGQLVLGPFQGKPACIRIPLGKGVCGTAAETLTAQLVPDVHAFPGHIACDADSRSEVVIPMTQGGRLVGVLDIDSPSPNRFDEADVAGLHKVVDVLLQHTSFVSR